MASRKAADAGSASYDSSSSASSDDDVLITKKHRQKLQGLNTPRVKPEAPAPAPAAAPPPVTKSPLNKPDHICGVCERDGGDLVVCTGSCVSAFHVACLPRAHRDAASCSSTDQWKCPSCVTNTHVCFHCKERGRVVVSDASASPDDAASHSADETNTKPALRAVVKCRALSCGKFYHQKCIAKLPLARIAGARFICPLHTCAACEQSGAKKEPVRCTRCPVAYHTSCLPRSGVVPLPGKRIICPKHEGQALVMEDEEEKERAHEEEGEVVEPVVAKQAPAIARITAQEDQDADVSVAASSPRTEENENEAEDDARSETSTSATTSSGVKKHSKSSKKDKKKKKKKKKKDKKSKDKERSSKGGDEASSEKEDGGKKVKRSSKSSSSNKAERRTDEDDGHGDDTGEERDEKKTSSAVHTASEDDDEEEKATVVVTESVVVKKESVVPSSSPQPESQDSHESTKGATMAADVASAEEEPAAVMNAFDDEPKPEPEREEHVDITTPLSKSERADDVKPMSPLPQSKAEPVVSETVSPHGDHEEPREDEKTSESLPALDVSENTERASPSPAVKNDPPYRTDDESRDHLTVQIPEISMSGLATGDDGEVDEDSGSGSGSQSNKARNSDKQTTEDAVKEKPSGGSSRSKKSKKKQRKGGGKGGGDESVKREGDAAEPREEAKWVQCDDCKKWRTVAKEIDLDAMPETWSCTMNTWNKAFASCDVPEEVVETKKSSSKPTKRAALGEVGTPVPKKAKLTKQNSVPEIVQTPASEESIATAIPEKEAKIVKKADKDSKKRKLKLKLREKYGEVHWVQCENKQCGKWRVVPSSASTLPSVWYCSLNTWAPELASCSAANPPEVEAYLSKSQSKKPSGTRPPKRQRGPDNGDQTNLAAASGQGDAVAPARPAGIKPIKNSGGGKSATPTAHASGGSVGSGGTAAAASVGGASGNVVDARAGAKALTGVKSVVLEWAQCEKCLKWRKLPAHIKSSTLPDKWFCSMNHWDPPSRASCAVPQEDDQEPLVDASPLPSSQNWYPMPGQVSGNTSTGTGTTSAMRSKRGKLSYSELLYASTGQLRKTYTSESSTLSFEYEGTVYHRDDQYNKSSLYLSPLTTNKLTGEPIDPQRKDKELSLFSNTSAQKALVDKVATVILSTIDLRRDFAITEIVDSVLNDGMVSGEGDLSLSVITTAIAQLVACGELEKVDRSQTRHEWPVSSGDTTTASILLRSLSSQPAFYRKVPKRPLKALKAWKVAVRL